jgi:SAM-dependent methyltransferase
MLKDYNYDLYAKYYDVFELDPIDNKNLNNFVLKVLKKHRCKSVLDLTCGTGEQAILLGKKGFSVIASDFSKGMVEIAKAKAKKEKVKISFSVGDMRNRFFGKEKFDSVITMFNAIAHVNTKGFEETVRNISNQLKPKGIYIFDIDNLDAWKDNCQDYEFLDTAVENKDGIFVRFCKYTLKNSRLRVYQRLLIQENYNKPKVIEKTWDSQLYTSLELEKTLAKNGFETIWIYGNSNFKKFDAINDSSIFVVAQKK